MHDKFTNPISIMNVLNGNSPSQTKSGLSSVGHRATILPNEIREGMPRYWSPHDRRRIRARKKEVRLP